MSTWEDMPAALRQAFRAQKCSRRELARKLDMPQATLARALAEPVDMRLATLVRVWKALGYTVSVVCCKGNQTYLFEEKETP